MNEKNIILSCKCWKELDLKLRNLTTNNQTVLGGSTFALFLKYYLETSSIYASKLEKIWLLDEVDSSIKIKLNLPNRDEGIDLIAKTFDEKYWAIQAKYRSDFNSSLTVSGKGSLASFNNLAFGYCKNISYGLVASTVNKSPKKTYLLNKDIGYLTLDAFLELDEPSNHHWNNIIQKVNDNFVSIKNEIPKPHQSTAVSKCINYFKKNNVGKLFMPCGTGKTLVSSTLARKIQAKSVLIVVPSLNLVSQMLKHWTKEFIGNGILSDWIIVCSDKTVTNDKNDDTFKGFIHDLGVPTTTDVNYVKEFLQNNNDRIKIVIVTYQSGNIVSSASKLNKFTFDLAIFDEAHKTVGHKEKVKAILLQEKNINIKKRLFMTATERTFKKNDKEFVSMDNQNIYVRTIHTLTVKDAIQQKEPIISDYKVITLE